MSLQAKIVIVLSEGLAPAEAANAAAVLGLSASATAADLGAEGVDAVGRHYGLDRLPAPVLVADQALLAEQRHRATANHQLHIAAFSEVGRRARDYDTYLAELARTSPQDNRYAGLLVRGPRNRVIAATKRLRLYGASNAQSSAPSLTDVGGDR